MSNAIAVIDQSEFEEKILQVSHQQPVLLYYWAHGCSPCAALHPLLEKLAHQHKSRVQVAKIELDDNMKLAGRLKVSGIPTVIRFQGGQETGRMVGAKSEPEILQFMGV